MSELKISKTNNGYILEKNGKEFELSWNEFCDIVNFGIEIDARDEIESYLNDYAGEECQEAFSMTRDEIFNNENILNSIVEKLIGIRNASESLDDVYDAIEIICKNMCKKH